jgi:hypothetical protein
VLPRRDFLHVSIIQPCQSWAWAQIRNPSIDAGEAALDLIDVAPGRADAQRIT